MKKYILLFALIQLSLNSNANIAPSQAFIQEIFIDSTGNWTIEISFRLSGFQDIDSIKLETSSGMSLITNYTCLPGCPPPGYADSLLKITNANLLNPLTINISGDFVRLYSYSTFSTEVDSVSFGNYPGSFFNVVHPGQSISWVIKIESQGYSDSFTLDNSPTVGNCNDTTNALGTFSGKIYRPDGSLFTEGHFQIGTVPNLVAFIQSDGTFSERVFARAYPMQTVTIWFAGISNWTDTTYSIIPVNPWIEPDSSVSVVIQTIAVISNNDEKKRPSHEIVVYPNPFISDISFYFNNNSYFKDALYSIKIYDLKGNLLQVIRCKNTSSKTTWSPGNNFPPGIYTYVIETGSKIIQSGKIVRLSSF